MNHVAAKWHHPRIVGYIRVSTDKQTDNGCSLAAQESKLRAYAVATELRLVEVLSDPGYSAKSLLRPGLEAALAMLDDGRADGILVAKLDRLSRSVKDLGHLVDKYFTKDKILLSVGDSIDTRTAGGRLVLNVLASVSQWEREAISERTRDALAHLKAGGKKLGRSPLQDPEILAVVSSLRSKHHSLATIAATLEELGYKTQRGGRWAAETVRLILNRMEEA